MSHLDPGWPTTPHTAGDKQPSPHGGWSRRWAALVTLAVILGAISLVAIPIASVWLPQEIARWHEAAAADKSLDDDFDGAIESIDRALHWNPDRRELLIYRARYQLDQDNPRGALDDLNQLIQAEPRLEPAYMLRSQACQSLGRYQAAVDDWKRIRALQVQQGQALSPIVRNGLAYARALAGIELDEAMKDINIALEVYPGQAALLDTRGFVALQAGDAERALDDLDQAVRVAEDDLQEGVEAQPTYDVRYHRQEEENRKREVAVLRYHRALAYQELGRTKEAEQDLSRVRELGFEPGESLF